MDNQDIIRFDIPLYSQGWTHLCWAYCQVMAECFKKNIKLTSLQAKERAQQLSLEQNGVKNKTGWPTNATSLKDVSSLQDLHDILARHGAVYADYSSKKNSNKAHMVLVTGVDLCKNIVYTNNPDGCFGFGIRGQQTFEQFKNGCATSFLYGLFCRNYLSKIVLFN